MILTPLWSLRMVCTSSLNAIEKRRPLAFESVFLSPPCAVSSSRCPADPLQERGKIQGFFCAVLGVMPLVCLVFDNLPSYR